MSTATCAVPDRWQGMQRELVERAIGGDHDAFTILVDGSVDRLYALATLILRDSDRAQDAVQDALVAAWKGLSALRDPDAWDAWLHRLTVRACYHAARRDRRRTLVELHVTPDLEPAAADATAMLAERDRLERLLGRLPIDQRAVIVLRYFDDLTEADVAAALGISVGTVKSHSRDALGRLRNQQAGEEQSGGYDVNRRPEHGRDQADAPRR